MLIAVVKCAYSLMEKIEQLKISTLSTTTVEEKSKEASMPTLSDNVGRPRLPTPKATPNPVEDCNELVSKEAISDS